MIGETLAHFRVTAKLGEGGMGAVYRAEDTKLGREVAIKVLPEAVAGDPERLARFEREAKVLASLSHPNVAGIHEVGEATVGEAEVRFLVMELAPGVDLSERLAHGPCTLEEALDIAIQIAAGLEAAHERGIVHRDLKPANVKIAPDGQVKILDFGLAKALEAPGAAGTAPELSLSPTLTAQMTQAGMLLGTAAYMSPEQARGQEADRRADVWAFGLILVELLSGRKAFDEPTVSDTLAAVLKMAPDLGGLPPETPPALRRLVDRCLQKDPRERLRDMGDVGLELREIRAGGRGAGVEAGEAAASAPARAKGGRLALLLAGAAVGVALALAAGWLLPRNEASREEPVVRFQIQPPPGTAFSRGLAVSPDGKRLALTVLDEDRHVTDLWVRELDSLEARRLPGTEGARYPFWSPDGRELGFFAAYELRAVDLTGAPPRTIAATAAPVDNRGASWGTDGTIVYSPRYFGPLSRVPANGGEPEPASTLDPDLGSGTHRFPWFLPDGRHFLFYAAPGSGGEPGSIHLGTLGSTVSKPLTPSHSMAVFLPPRWVIYSRGEVVVAQALDLEREELVGEAVPLGPRLPGGLSISGYRSLGVSLDGTLVYRVEDYSRTRLTWNAPDGSELRLLDDDVSWYYAARISPDGSRVAVSRYAPDSNGGDLWLFERARGVGRPLVTSPLDDDEPVWSPDGSQLAYGRFGVDQSLRVFDVANPSSERVLYEAEGLQVWPVDWMPDGSGLVVGRSVLGSQVGNIALLRFDGSGELESVLANDFGGWWGQASPDGRWLLYGSDASGRGEVYVSPLGSPGAAWQVSTAGGDRPRWSRDGNAIYFLAVDGWMCRAEVTGRDPFTTGEPERLFEARLDPDTSWGYDVAPDGTFVLARLADDLGQPVSVVLGADQLLK